MFPEFKQWSYVFLGRKYLFKFNNEDTGAISVDIYILPLLNGESLLNRMPSVPTCQRGLHANVLACQRGLRAIVPACQRVKNVPTCQ